MVDLVEQIETYIQEANILGHTIENSNFLIDRLDGENEELKEHYLQQIAPIVQEYIMIIKALEFLFLEYFEWEKQNSTTRNLRYRRLYNTVIKDLAKTTQPI